MFNQQELQILIGGTEDPVDVVDLRANTVYGGAYDDSHDTVKAFWKAGPRIFYEWHRLTRPWAY